MEDILVVYYQPQTRTIVKPQNVNRLEGILINLKSQTPVNSKYLDEIKDEEWKEWSFHSACSTGDPTRVMLIYTKK